MIAILKQYSSSFNLFIKKIFGTYQSIQLNYCSKILTKLIYHFKRSQWALLKTKSAQALIKKRHHVAMGYMAIRTQSTNNTEGTIHKITKSAATKVVSTWIVRGCHSSLRVGSVDFFWKLYAFIIPSTLVLGINYFVIITHPLHRIQVRKRSSCSCYMIETYNTHHRFPCYWSKRIDCIIVQPIISS